MTEWKCILGVDIDGSHLVVSKTTGATPQAAARNAVSHAKTHLRSRASSGLFDLSCELAQAMQLLNQARDAIEYLGDALEEITELESSRQDEGAMIARKALERFGVLVDANGKPMGTVPLDPL
jgi:hypothetical protein